MSGEIEQYNSDGSSKHLAPDAGFPAETVMQEHSAPKAEHRGDEQIGEPSTANG